MTCEVAVMNKRGIALAADSAVSLGHKIYHSAEKLFSLSPSIPVAIMTFGSADLMSVPWEIIVKTYAGLGTRKFDSLEQYGRDFFTFIEGSGVLFPSEHQKGSVKAVVYELWSELYRDRLLEKLAPNAQYRDADGITGLAEIIRQYHGAPYSDADTITALAEIIREDREGWAKIPDIEGLGAQYGARVVNVYEAELDEVEKDVFKDLSLPPEIKQQLRQTVAFVFGKQCFPAFESGIVIAGMGEIEPFPSVLEYRVGTVAADRLRFVKSNETRIGETEAVVMPLAQRETIDMIIGGIHPGLLEKIVDSLDRFLRPEKGEEHNEPNQPDKRKQAFRDYVGDEISRPYAQHFMDAVSALPRQDLAKMAEALVSLTAFLMRMRLSQYETVAEPIDVAVLSKGDGFIWVKHKNLVRERRASRYSEW